MVSENEKQIWYAGQALNGMLSEVRLGKLTDQEIDFVCRKAHSVGRRMRELESNYVKQDNRDALDPLDV